MSVFHDNALIGASGAGVEPTGYTIDRSIRLNSSDSAYLNRTPSSAGNRRTFTWSNWIKRSELGNQGGIFSSYTGAHPSTFFRFNTDDTFQLEDRSSSASNFRLVSDAVFRDPGAWFHLVVSVDTTQATASDRVKIYINGEQVTSFSTENYPSQNLELDWNTATEHRIGRHSEYLDGYLAEIHCVDGQALAPTDFGEYDDNNVWQPINFNHSNKPANLGAWPGMTTGTPFNATYSIANLFDGNTSTRMCPISGSSCVFTPTTPITVSSSIRIFGLQSSTNQYFKINDTVVTNVPNSFSWFTPDIGSTITSLNKFEFFTTSGTFAAVVGAIEIDGEILTIGDINSFHLDFSDNSSASALGTDSSGNSNDWTANNISVTAGAGNDSLVDSPTNYGTDTGAGGEVRGNYCTWNPVFYKPETLSNGNLDYSAPGIAGVVRGTIAIPQTGKWYWEVTGNDRVMVGIEKTDAPVSIGYPGANTNGYSYAGADGRLWYNATSSAYGSTFGLGDIIGVAFDADNGRLFFSKNSTWQNSGNPLTGSNPAVSGLTGSWTPCIGRYDGSPTASVNFGQRPFAYTAPSGYKALCTTNLPDPTIADGSTAMDAKLYTGNGSTQSITGYNMSPDLVWVKSRSATTGHRLFDTVRGDYKLLESNSTTAEVTNTNQIAITSSGFDTGNSINTNDNNDTYVAWTWDGGTSNTSISVGGLNSSAYDQSQTWSSTGTSTNTTSIADAFDGDLTSFWGATNATVSRYTFASVYSGTKFELYMTVSLAATNFSVNGQSSSSVTGPFSPQWVDVTDAVTASGLGGLSYIDISFSAAQYATYIYAIKIDGKILVDSDVTPPNVPSIASTVRANPTAGFSIVTWTTSGTTGDYISVGHGLNALPGLVITKTRSNTDSWYTAHGFDLTQFGMLNSTNAFSAAGVAWGDGITSSVIGMRVGNFTANNYTHVAYCFAPVEGYSAFGSYDATQPFVYLGFTPRWIMLKDIDAAEDWRLFDSARNTFNVTDTRLEPNTSDQEASTATLSLDFLSNGFKIIGGGSSINGHVIYAAFAEHPFKTARAR